MVGLVNAGGNVVGSYGYDPYGQMVVKTGAAADGNPWRYTGAYLDSTGLYKMGARYYDAARGRFTQRDLLGGGYPYAADNPVNFVDPSGLNPVDEFDPEARALGRNGGVGNGGFEPGSSYRGFDDDDDGHSGGGGATRTDPPPPGLTPWPGIGKFPPGKGEGPDINLPKPPSKPEVVIGIGNLGG